MGAFMKSMSKKFKRFSDNLEKPIVFYDLETTGLDVKNDRICHASFTKVSPNGDIDSRTRFINPTIPIPQEAIDVHGTANEKVKDCPTFKQLAKGLFEFIQGCDVGGYNIKNFDNPLLAEEFYRCGIVWPEPGTRFVDACTIFKKRHSRTLEAAYEFYTGKQPMNAHDAEFDTFMTMEVLAAQVDKYEDLTYDIELLDKESDYNERLDLAGCVVRNDKGVAVFSFGKHKGKPVSSEPEYVEWMLSANFTHNTKEILEMLKNR